MLILKTLSWGSLHGYGISSAIQRQTGKALLVEEGALYPALYRMEIKGWIEAEWGLSENSRRAKYYQLTTEGRRRLRTEIQAWREYTIAVSRLIDATCPYPEGA